MWSGNGKSQMDDIEDGAVTTRRRFLQGAALGVVSLSIPTIGPALRAGAIGSGTEREFVTQSASISQLSPWEWVDSYQGSLESIQNDLLSINVGDIVREVSLTSSTNLWNGQWGGGAPEVGDRVLIRSVTPGVAEYAYANLGATRGVIMSGSGGSYVLQSHGMSNPGLPELSLTFSKNTFWQDASSGQQTGPVRLSPGDGVWVAGLLTSEGIVAAAVDYMTQESMTAASAFVPAAPQIVTVRDPANPDIAYCYKTWNGYASYEDCATGAGACGTCNTGNNGQAAWPFRHGSCSYACTSQCSLKCGDSFYVFPCEGGTGTTLKMVDVGPCQRDNPNCPCSPTTCSRTCTGDPCGIDGTTAVIDMTLPTFTRFYPPLNKGGYGCFSVSVAVACMCGDCLCPY